MKGNNMGKITNLFIIFLLVCFTGSSCCNSKRSICGNSADSGKDTIYTNFREYEETILAYEKNIINQESKNVVIKVQDSNNICESELMLIGSILDSKNDTITILKIENIYGLKQSPHARGSIVVYKNRIRQGYYSDFYKGFFAETKNNLLFIKDVKDVDSEGNPIFGVLNTIDFRDEIPQNIFIYTEKDAGDEHCLMKEF